MCQAIILHLVFKTRKEELDQLKSGLESLSVINFLKVSEGSLKYVFPLQSEAMVTKDDFLKVIETSVDSLEGDEKKAYDWFVQYVHEVANTVSAEAKDQPFSSPPTLAQLVQFVAGHPYLPPSRMNISFSAMVYPDADTCFLSLRLPNIYSSYDEFRKTLNTAIYMPASWLRKGLKAVELTKKTCLSLNKAFFILECFVMLSSLALSKTKICSMFFIFVL